MKTSRWNERNVKIKTDGREVTQKVTEKIHSRSRKGLQHGEDHSFGAGCSGRGEVSSDLKKRERETSMSRAMPQPWFWQ